MIVRVLPDTESGGAAAHSRRIAVVGITAAGDITETGRGTGYTRTEPIPPANAVVFLDTLVLFGKENFKTIVNLIAGKNTEGCIY
jgi:hypothetical protein